MLKGHRLQNATICAPSQLLQHFLMQKLGFLPKPAKAKSVNCLIVFVEGMASEAETG